MADRDNRNSSNSNDDTTSRGDALNLECPVRWRENPSGPPALQQFPATPEGLNGPFDFRPYPPVAKPKRNPWLIVVLVVAIIVLVGAIAGGVATFVVQNSNRAGNPSVVDANTKNESDAQRVSDDRNAPGPDGKPSKAEVEHGMRAMMGDGFALSGTSEEELSASVPFGLNFDAFYGCAVDGFYDGLSAESLHAIVREEDLVGISVEEGQIFEDAGNACFRELLP